MILIYLGMCTAIEEFDSACHCATDSKPYMTYPVMEILQHLGQYMEWSNKIILYSFSRHNVVVGRYGIVLSYRLAEVHWLTFITESADVRPLIYILAPEYIYIYIFIYINLFIIVAAEVSMLGSTINTPGHQLDIAGMLAPSSNSAPALPKQR